MFHDDKEVSGDTQESADPQLREQMERYIDRNYKAEEIEPYPPEWLNDAERASFCNISEELLGEQKSDQWLQNKVFKSIGEDSQDFDRPLNSTEVSVLEGDNIDFGPYADLLLKTYSNFINRVITELCKNPKFSSDMERVSDGMMAGIAYALNDPKPDNMDQRLNFLALFPENLATYAEILKYSNESQALKFWLRLQSVLTAVKISVKKDEELTDGNRADGWRSIFSMRKKSNGKELVISQLAQIAEDTEKDAGDGAISYVGRIVANGKNEAMERFIRFHIERRTLSSRTRESKRKQHEESLFMEGEDGDMTIGAQISLTEEITENGTIVNSAASRHAYERSETYEERRQKAEKAQEITSDSFSEVVKLAEEIHCSIRNESLSGYDELIASGKPTNDSDILGFLLPEALRYYIRAAVSQINALILPKNEAALERAKKKGVRLAYKLNRSVISFTQSGRSDLANVVDLEGFKVYFAPYTEGKKCVYEAYKKGVAKEVIARENNLDIAFVEETIRQIELVWRSPLRHKRAVYSLHEGGKTPEQIGKELNLSMSFVRDSLVAYDKEKADNAKKGIYKNIGQTYLEYFESIDGASVKNGFSWRWGRILQVLYAPIKDEHNDALIEKAAKRIEDKLANLKHISESRRKDLVDLLQMFKKGKRYEFLEKLCDNDRSIFLRRHVARLYMIKEPGAMIDLASLLPAHSFISEGTIPAAAFPERVKADVERIKEKKDKKAYIEQNHWTSLVRKEEYCNLQPGAAWGHNVCRSTGESNIRMYYDVFHGGLNRNNANHKIIRDRAAAIIKMRRAKAVKNVGDSRSRKSDTKPAI